MLELKAQELRDLFLTSVMTTVYSNNQWWSQRTVWAIKRQKTKETNKRQRRWKLYIFMSQHKEMSCENGCKRHRMSPSHIFVWRWASKHWNIKARKATLKSILAWKTHTQSAFCYCVTSKKSWLSKLPGNHKCGVTSKKTESLSKLPGNHKCGLWMPS